MQNNPNLPLSLWLWRQHISVYSCKLISFRWISNVSSNYIQHDLFINWHPGRCIFCLSCIRCCSKCIFCIECWRASSRNLSSFTNTHNSILLCGHTHIFIGVFSRKSIEEVQEKKMLLEKLQVRMNEAEAKANKLKVSFENLRGIPL